MVRRLWFTSAAAVSHQQQQQRQQQQQQKEEGVRPAIIRTEEEVLQEQSPDNNNNKKCDRSSRRVLSSPLRNIILRRREEDSNEDEQQQQHNATTTSSSSPSSASSTTAAASSPPTAIVTTTMTTATTTPRRTTIATTTTARTPGTRSSPFTPPSPISRPFVRPRRRRVNSRDIPRTYSGLYAHSDDLLPFEVMRQSPKRVDLVFLSASYVAIVCLLQGCSASVASMVCSTTSTSVCHALLKQPAAFQELTMTNDVSYSGNNSMIAWEISWTLTNLLHLLLTIFTVHWWKGCLFAAVPCGDSQGEMNGLTAWEQIEAMQRGEDMEGVKRLLWIAPTVLTYVACSAARYAPAAVLLNLFLWAVAVVAKLPVMNGVRIFGINRTTGIDDDRGAEEEEDEDFFVATAGGTRQ